MNAPVETVALKIGDGVLTVPAVGLARAWLEREFTTARPPLTASNARLDLPAIGAPWLNGIYAGLTIQDNAPHALILLPGDSSGAWKDALAWADQQNGVLPSRIDVLLLFQRLQGEFKAELYWTSEECAGAGTAGYAWVQTFGSGYQYSAHKSDDYRARAVRRVAITQELP